VAAERDAAKQAPKGPAGVANDKSDKAEEPKETAQKACHLMEVYRICYALDPKKLFGIVETFGNALFLEDHSGGDDGPGQRPPSGFIDAAHQARNAGENARLVSKIRHRRAYSAGITAARTGDPAER